MRTALLLALAALTVAACHDQAGGGAGTRAQISVVGSSTVYPFSTAIAERLVASVPGIPAPVIEATGTGAGFRLFCAGIGPAFPDIADASRRMTPGEYRGCAAHGVARIIEVPIGLDGIAIAEALDGPRLALSPATLYRALAAAPGGRVNTAATWADIDPALPASPIRVYGPPATSGTRDAFADLVLARGCAAVDPAAGALAHAEPAAHAARCTRIREDGAYVDAGENDNLVIQKLRTDVSAIGVVGYSYLEENRGAVRGVPLAGVAPTYAAIADGRYPGSRPLFLYVKAAHLDAVPGLRTYLRLYADAWRPNGPLVRRGLIAGSDAMRARAAAILAGEMVLDPRSLG
jgi:phosphate transport system substrate-binding protein